MKKTFLFIALVIVLLGGFFFLRKSDQNKPSDQATITNNQPGNIQTDNSQEQVAGFAGKLIAGKKSPFLEFNREDYEKAQSSGKVIFLDFYANWCPVCRGEAPEIESGFNSVEADNLVGFRVNYNDSETDDDEKKLAQQFAITYQHTKVIIKEGKEVLKDGEPWDSERFLGEINKYL